MSSDEQPRSVRTSLVSFGDAKATSDPAPHCPLCAGTDTVVFHDRLHGKRFWDCKTCRLAFVEPKYRLDAAKEKERYDLHENSPNDKGYVKVTHTLFHTHAPSPCNSS